MRRKPEVKEPVLADVLAARRLLLVSTMPVEVLEQMHAVLDVVQDQIVRERFRV